MPTVFWITHISWTRVTVNFDVTLKSDPLADTSHAGFTLVGDGQEFPVASRRLADDVYRLSLNVTNFHDRGPVPDGAWRIVGHAAPAPGRPALCGTPLLRALDISDRVFLYDQHRASYTVSFGVSDDSESAVFTMFTYQMSRRGGGLPRARQNGRLRPRARSIFERHVRRRVANRYYRTVRAISRPSGNTILFASDARSEIEGNLVRIRDRMVERGLDERFSFRYSFRPPHGNSKWSTLRVIARLAAADIVLLDDYFALLEFLDLARWHESHPDLACRRRIQGLRSEPVREARLPNPVQRPPQVHVCDRRLRPTHPGLGRGIRHRGGGRHPNRPSAYRHVPRARARTALGRGLSRA